MPTSQRAVHDLSLYTAEPGSSHEERLRFLASWSAPGPRSTSTTSAPDRSADRGGK
ncbi:hypothetical protein LZ318_40930 [Saccharopolyspora indica]